MPWYRLFPVKLILFLVLLMGFLEDSNAQQIGKDEKPPYVDLFLDGQLDFRWEHSMKSCLERVTVLVEDC